jgi:thioredoxin reductase (NADPH)
MGTTPNLLQVPGESGPDGYFGRGVSTCAICDGNLYRNKTVAVVGGGDSAATEAIYLSKIAKKVYLLVRSDKLRANFANQQKIKSSPNIEILFETKITKINGDGKKVTSISILSSKTDIENNIALDGVFLAIGSTPNTETLRNDLTNNLEHQLILDENGYIKLFDYQETSQKGIFAAGDIADPKFKQAITASGDSVKAALQAIEFLNIIGHTPKGFSKEKAVNEIKQQEKIPETELISKEKEETGFVINIESEKQFKKILSKSDFVIADFYGSFCIPCQQMAPIFKKTAQNFSGKVTFIKIDVEENNEITQKNGISAVPTFIIFKNGQAVKRFGAHDGKKLEQEINSVLSNN